MKKLTEEQRVNLLNETLGCLEETEQDIKAFENKIKEWHEVLQGLYINRRNMISKVIDLLKGEK